MAANQNVTQLTQQSGTASTTSLFYAVINGTTDTGLPLSVFVNSLGLTGTPTAPTATTGTNTTQIASTAFVQAQLTSTLASYAPLASPTFTGTVTIPTVTISGGTINGASVGATTPSTGAFTTLSSTGLANLSSLSTSSATISGGAINSTSVGATTPSSGAFTTLTASSSITPPQAGGIVGTTTNNNANTGAVGEYISSQVLSGSAIALTSGTIANITSISLGAGDWDVWGNVATTPGSGTVTQQLSAWMNTTSVTAPTPPNNGGQYFQNGMTAANAAFIVPVGAFRLSLSTTTTVYLSTQCSFTTSTLSMYGFIGARRRR